MRKKVLVCILATALAFAVCGCGDSAGNGGNRGNSGIEDDKSAEGSVQQKPGEGISQDDIGGAGDGSSTSGGGAGGSGTDDSVQGNLGGTEGSSAQGNSGGSGGQASGGDRHFYKTIAFYGEQGALITDMMVGGTSGYGDYNAAVVLDYDTETGEITRIRVAEYYEAERDDPEWTARNKNYVVRSLSYPLFNFDYTEEIFEHYYGGDDPIRGDVGVMVWELPGDPLDYPFSQYITRYFSGQVVGPAQDIDGFIKAVFYDEQEQGKPVMGLPVFTDNGCYTASFYAPYTICWYDTEWDVKMRDELWDIGYNLHTDTGVDLADFGTTSYNTGGGYEGKYNYKDYMR